MNFDKVINEIDTNCESNENQSFKSNRDSIKHFTETMSFNGSDNMQLEIEVLQKHLNNVNLKMNTFLKEIATKTVQENEHRHHEMKTNSENYLFASLNLNMTTKLYSRTKNGDEFPERLFIKRNSLLTEMFKISHFRTIRNVFASIMVIVALHIALDELIKEGKVSFNFELVFWCFGSFQKVFYTWILMKLCTSLLVYYCFDYWSKYRLIYIVKNIKQYDKTTNKKYIINLFDFLWAIGYCVYMILFLVLPASVVIINKLPPASAIIILGEQLRMLMKSYAFVRSNVPRALRNGQLRIDLNSKPNSDQETEKSTFNCKKLISTSEQSDSEDDNENDVKLKKKSQEHNEKKLCPDFSSYLYFLFVPTFIYRDSYPRNAKIKWHNVFNQLFQVFVCSFYMYFIILRFCMPVFKHFNKEHLTVKMFVLSILSCQLPGGLLLVIIFYGLLHCWLNAFAEMLRFADRMFYTDWWNSTNYSNYFRTWNIVVHDWLYTYIYKDLHHILGKNNRILCQFLILLLSAIFHEYLITLTLGFFYPIMFPMFAALGFGFMLIKCDKNSNLGNFLTWLSLQIGFGIQISLYSIEYYVRLNCSQSIESNFLDFILPRSFTCGMNLNSTVSFNHFNREL